MRLFTNFDARISVYSIFVAACLSFGIVSCTSDDDGADLEAEEPVENEGEAPAESEAGAEPATAQPESTAPQAPEVPEAPAMGAPPSATGATPSSAPSMSTTRRVMYVKSNGVKMYDAASPTGKVVKTLKKGDHILFNVEGEWGRTDDGKFVALKDLSEKGIGRGKMSKGKWTNPSSSGN